MARVESIGEVSSKPNGGIAAVGFESLVKKPRRNPRLLSKFLIGHEVIGSGWESIVTINGSPDMVHKIFRGTSTKDHEGREQKIKALRDEHSVYQDIYGNQVTETSYGQTGIRTPLGRVDAVVGIQERVTRIVPLFEGRKLSEHIGTFALESLYRFYKSTTDAIREDQVPDIGGEDDIVLSRNGDVQILDARVIRTTEQLRKAAAEGFRWPLVTRERLWHLSGYLATRHAISATDHFEVFESTAA